MAFRYTVDWQDNKGNRTEHVGICADCLEIIEPEWRERREPPFFDYYEHQHKLVFLVLLSINNRRHWAYEGEVKDAGLWAVLRSAGRLWENGGDVDAVKAHAKKLLSELKPG